MKIYLRYCLAVVMSTAIPTASIAADPNSASGASSTKVSTGTGAATKGPNIGGTSVEKTLGIYEAVKTTLDQSPNIKIQNYQVDIAKGTERAQGGAFDITSAVSATSAAALSTVGIGPSGGVIRADYNTQTLTASGTKKFRTGVSATLGYNITQTDPRQGPKTTSATTNVSTFTFQLDIPLLKGAGRVSAAAAEKAAKYNTDAAVFDFKHLIATSALATIKAYWTYAAAYEVLKYRNQARDTIKHWSEAKSPFQQYMGGLLAEREKSVAEATQQLEQAKIALARAMGIQTNTVDAMGVPNTSEFPQNWQDVLSQFDANQVEQHWLTLAEQNRNDIKAQSSRVLSAKTTLDKAEKDINPTLNLTLGYGTTGFAYGNHFSHFVDSVHENVRSPSHSAGLVFSYPIGNNVARGTLDAAKASHNISTLQLDEATRGVKLSVSENVAVVNGSLKQAIEADKSLKSYLDAYNDILERGGFDTQASLTDLITIQDKLDDAAIEYIESLRDLANAIAQARYEVGVLISGDEHVDADITLAKLTSLP